MQTSGVFAMAHVDPQADLPVQLVNSEAIPVLQREQRVHQSEVGVNVWHRQRQWGYTEGISQRSGQINLLMSSGLWKNIKQNYLGFS